MNVTGLLAAVLFVLGAVGLVIMKLEGFAILFVFLGGACLFAFKHQ